MKGLVHIYCGDGKGKTTAAIGLSIRASGHGIPVLFAQFLKDGTSGELTILKEIGGVQTLYVEKNLGFYSKMSEETKEEARYAYRALLEDAIEKAKEMLEVVNTEKTIKGVLILDEIIAAYNYSLTSSRKSPSSNAKSVKWWVGTCPSQSGYKPRLTSCKLL